MKVGDCMNVWRETDTGTQWTDLDCWFDRGVIEAVADQIHTNHDDIRRVAVIRIKSLKGKQV